MYGYVYKTTNTVNGKIYVGKHKSDVFVGLQYIGSGVLLRKAINKYGLQSFQVELLESCETLEELNCREKYWIETLSARDSSVGYNLAYGGDGGDIWGSLPEELQQQWIAKLKNQPKRVYVNDGTETYAIPETKLDSYLDHGFVQGVDPFWHQQLLNASRQWHQQNPDFRNDGMFKTGGTPWNAGISPSEETRQKLREINLGKQHSEETKKKQSASLKAMYASGSRVPAMLGKDAWNKGMKMKWITNGTVDHQIPLDDPIPEGFRHGRSNFTPSRDNGKQNAYLKGTVWVTNGRINKQVPKNQLESYLEQGYRRGMTQKPHVS